MASRFLRPGDNVKVRVPYEPRPIAVRVTAANNERGCGYDEQGRPRCFTHADIVDD